MRKLLGPLQSTCSPQIGFFCTLIDLGISFGVIVLREICLSFGMELIWAAGGSFG